MYNVMITSALVGTALGFGLPLAVVALAAIVGQMLIGAREDGTHLRARDGLRAAWVAAGVTLLALLVGSLVTAQHIGWACPALPGCRPDVFWPVTGVGNLVMSFRLIVVLAALLGWWVAARTVLDEQPRPVIASAATAAALGLVYLIVLSITSTLALWDIFLPVHAGAAGIWLMSTVLLGLVMRRYGQRAPIRKPEAPIEGSLSTTLRYYITLTKPRVISLLLLTTLAAMLLAVDETHPVSFGLVCWTLLGGYLAAGGANAINMYFDRDVDALMGRTSRRPLPSSHLRPENALIFGIALNLLAFVVIALSSNVLAALLALAGSAYYVQVYTRMLKRTTPHNIVVGGAAGAIPPLVGWAAVTGQLNVASLLLFAIIFYWTPPHFWALALLRRADYAHAGIPMLPVARGEGETKLQILLYSFLMVAISILPTPLRVTGLIYLLIALVLGVWFIRLAFKLFREPGTTTAWPLYKYSLLYLALLFGGLVIDHLVKLSLT